MKQLAYVASSNVNYDATHIGIGIFIDATIAVCIVDFAIGCICCTLAPIMHFADDGPEAESGRERERGGREESMPEGNKTVR